jgi:hypothetical protein
MHYLDGDDKTVYTAAVMKTHPKAKAIYTAFSNGEVYLSTKEHYDVMGSLLLHEKTIGLNPQIKINGSQEVSVFYYEVNDGRSIIEVLAWNDYSDTTVQLTIPNLKGKTVKDMRQGRKIVVASAESDVLTVTLQADEVKLYVIGEPQRPSIDINTNGTTTEVMPNGQPVPVNFVYDTQNRGTCQVTVSLKKYGMDRAFASASTSVSGSGQSTVKITVPEYSRLDNSYLPTSDGINYYWEAKICNDAFATIPVLVEFLRPVNPLNITVPGGQEIVTKMSYNFLPSFLDEAYRGLVGIFKSSKTQAQDSGHYAKVNKIASMLLSLGYQQSTPDLSAYDSMKGDHGPFFWIFDDVTPTYMENGELATDLIFLQRRMRVIILAGDMVLSQTEVDNFKAWLADPTLNAAIVATEGGYSSVSSLFGVGTTVTKAGAAGASIVITNTSTPITSQLTSTTWNTGTISGGAWSSLQSAKALATYGDRPIFVMNRYFGGKTFAFNFDITALHGDPIAKQLWRGVTDWMALDPNVYKLRLEMYCGGIMLGFADNWLNNTWTAVHRAGTLDMKIKPSGSCGGTSYKAYLYPWHGDYRSNSIGFYNSDNDTTSSNTVRISTVLGIIIAVIVYVMF